MALERKYSAELKAEALAMVDELRSRDPGDRSAVRATSRALGVGEQSLRAWLKTRERRARQQAARAGDAPRLTSVDGVGLGVGVALGAGADDLVAELDRYRVRDNERERELVYLRGECARLRSAIGVLISP